MTAETDEPRCPFCGETRLIEHVGRGTWTCQVCAKSWTVARQQQFDGWSASGAEAVGTGNDVAPGVALPARAPERPLTCAFGAPWLDHQTPPIGTGVGCPWCAQEAERLCAAFDQAVARGEYDTEGYRPADRRAQARRLREAVG